MIRHKYEMTRTWESDGTKDTYTRKSQSLEQLIIETINIQENNQAKFIFVDRKENDEAGDLFKVHFVVLDETYEYECAATPKDVAELLELYVSEWGYQDTIEIQTI